MRYAKLINNSPVYAPNPILLDGFYVGNPPDGDYTKLGYKPVMYSPAPEPAEPGYYWREGWTETTNEIQQTWILEEKTEYTDAEAMQYLFGGVDNVE